MSSEQKALEIVKHLAEYIQASDEAGVQPMMCADALYGDDDEMTLRDAILACAGVVPEPGVTVDKALSDLVAYLTTCRSKAAEYTLISVGEKFAKIGCMGGGSVHCFIAVADFTNRALGVVKAGQIFKPASWKAPAKHARGDLFDINTWDKCFTDYGVRYIN